MIKIAKLKKLIYECDDFTIYSAKAGKITIKLKIFGEQPRLLKTIEYKFFGELEKGLYSDTFVVSRYEKLSKRVNYARNNKMREVE